MSVSRTHSHTHSRSWSKSPSAPNANNDNSIAEPDSIAPEPKTETVLTGERTDFSLFLGGLGLSTRVEDIIQVFKPYGEVKNVDIKQGYAFVDLVGDVDAAIINVNGKPFGGSSHNVRVEKARNNADVRRREKERQTAANEHQREVLFIVGYDPNHLDHHNFRKMLEKYGKIIRLDFIRSYSFVQYENLADAVRAQKELNNYPYEGTPIRVQFSTRGVVQQSTPRPAQDRNRPYSRGSNSNYYRDRQTNISRDYSDRDRDRRTSNRPYIPDYRQPQQRLPSPVDSNRILQSPAVLAQLLKVIEHGRHSRSKSHSNNRDRRSRSRSRSRDIRPRSHSRDRRRSQRSRDRSFNRNRRSSLSNSRSRSRSRLGSLSPRRSRSPPRRSDMSWNQRQGENSWQDNNTNLINIYDIAQQQVNFRCIIGQDVLLSDSKNFGNGDRRGERFSRARADYIQ
ncbi:MAG: hypothetical protein EZS28_006976 [Streblomastix strix]|uniref:RRM domain-containing protein n=1 Tax=Streblomastix strix TaxID=222440 RepID=A0A5J4WSE0_9EUKA|nr:MAG: hypothetical protein EZS28_006976 [Streblomastix strix]